MLLVLAAFFCSLLTHGTAKTSVFINPDSPFFVKQTPNGEILLRKSSPPSTSSPDFKALNELLDLYMRRNLSAPRTERPSYYYPLFNTPPSTTTTTSTTTHGPFITFSSTDFHRANNRVTKRWPPQGGGVISGGRLKPFQVVTLSPYKNIMDDSSRNKWPLYNLSSLKVKPDSEDLASPLQLFQKHKDDRFNLQLNTISQEKQPKPNRRVIVNRPEILTISEFLPGPVIVTNDQNKIVLESSTNSPSTTSTERHIPSPTTEQTFSLASFVAFEPPLFEPQATTEQSTTSTTTSTTTTESSEFGLSNIFSMISHQMEFISNSFLQKTSTSSEELSVAGSSSSGSSVSSSSNIGGIDPSAALIPAVLGGVIGLGLFVSELAKTSSSFSQRQRRRQRITNRGSPLHSPKSPPSFPRPSGEAASKKRPRKRKSNPLRRSGITQFVAADARQGPQYAGNFYYDYFNSDAFVNTNQ